jgi:hypothetical protein
MLIARLFAAARMSPPRPRARITKSLLACPRARLVRAVAWYVHEQRRAHHDEATLLEGARALCRGWTDWYAVDAVPPGAKPARSALPSGSADAMVIRAARWGNGWMKEAAPFVGVARASIDRATNALETKVGCLLHDDCVAVPELGMECLLGRRMLAG